MKTNASLIEQLNAFKTAGAANHPSAVNSNNNTFSILSQHRMMTLNASSVQALIVSRNELTQAGQVKPITDQMDCGEYYFNVVPPYGRCKRYVSYY